MSRRPSSPRPLVPALLALGFASLVSVPLAAHAQNSQVSQKPVLTTLHRFDGKYGAHPTDTPLLGKDSNFYGATQYGGLYDNDGNSFGTIYKMTREGVLTTLFRFNGKNGFNPDDLLTQGKDGAFYGVTYSGGRLGLGTTFRITPRGEFTTLHNFNGTDGALPSASLLAAPDGSFYGTAEQGGKYDYGTVFHMTATGQITTLHTFRTGDGYYPRSITFGPDGALYGTAPFGGSNGSGTIYRMTMDGTFSVLHSFAGSDGCAPAKSLTLGADGAFYGVTSHGGIGNHRGRLDGNGVAFKVTVSGTFTTLHKFSQDGHGTGPLASLTLDSDGNFYGTTGFGGAGETSQQFSGFGTVFRMTPSGQVTTLYKFHTAFDGSGPVGGLVFGPDGALYGTTFYGGAKGYGTIYKLTLP